MRKTKGDLEGPEPRPAVPAVLALLILATALGGPSPAGAEEAPDLARLWVEARDARGRVPADLAAEDFVILEGGEERPVASLGPQLAAGGAARGAARVALYFDQALAGNRTIKRSAESLGGLAGELAGLGEVEVVVAAAGAEAPTPEVELVSAEPLILGQHLARAALTDRGELTLLEIRRRTLADLAAPPGQPALSPEEVTEIVTAAVGEELELIRERRDRLLAWAFEPPAAEAGKSVAGESVTGAPGPRLLVLAADGFDLDPVAFYRPHLDPQAALAVTRNAALLPTLAAEIGELSRTLAAAGWTVLPLSFPAPEGEGQGFEYSSIESEDETAPGVDQGTTSAPGFTLRPGALRRRGQEEPAPPIAEARFVAPLEPLEQLAAETGGEVLTTDAGLRDAVERFAARRPLSYHSALSAPGASVSLEVRPGRGDLRLEARRWVSRGVPEAVTAVRLRRLLSGIDEAGGFDVAAVLRLAEPAAEAAAPTAGDLEVRLDLHDLEAASPAEEWVERASATLRLSVAVLSAAGEPRISSQTFADEDLTGRLEWRRQTAVELPPGATEVAVLVEELGRGHWGGRRATVLRGDWAAGDEVLPTPAVIEIRRPAKELLRGRVKFETEIYDPRVAAVDFVLDERQVERRTQAPFAARVDLGRTPRRRHLKVIAFDREGAELGSDSVVLNGGSGGLEVEIIRPESRRGTGSIEVEAEIAVPLERRLDRALFYWNNQPLATLYAPPFRQRVYIPPEQPAGYVRVVAMLDDGTTAEDVMFMNGPDASERLDVSLVELYVVVTDGSGRPVRGLGEADFRVREEGVAQEIATFSDASDLPLTLGMAIDSSASMFVKLPGIQRAAIGFLHSAFSHQDRAFVVDFDSEPRLARPITASLERLEQSIDSLEASGRTALWESIVFSLVQLQEVRGRKALIVFSDGADEDDQFPFRSSLDIAKKMGVPIYLILMRKQPKESSGLSLFTRSFTSRINRLVEATGGRVFYAKEYDRLDAVYEEIEDELRSQYLLAYYPRRPAASGVWRKVDVDVAGRGLVPRTLSGYWP